MANCKIQEGNGKKKQNKIVSSISMDIKLWFIEIFPPVRIILKQQLCKSTTYQKYSSRHSALFGMQRLLFGNWKHWSSLLNIKFVRKSLSSQAYTVDVVRHRIYNTCSLKLNLNGRQIEKHIQGHKLRETSSEASAKKAVVKSFNESLHV